MFNKYMAGPTLAVAALLLAACNGTSVNQSLSLGKGEQRQGNFSTVNGSVTVGDEAVVEGDVSTVNGSVRIGERATAGDLSSVNGAIRIGDGAQVGAVETVNGELQVGNGVRVAGALETTNGRILVGDDVVINGAMSSVNGALELGSSQVEGPLSNRNGNITLHGDCRVGGGVVMRSRRPSEGREPDVLTIGAGCEVAGDILVEREAVVRAHESAVFGSVHGAEVERFD